MIAYATDDKVFIKNIITDKQVELDIEDVSVIFWSEENEELFLGTENGHIVGYKVDH